MVVLILFLFLLNIVSIRLKRLNSAVTLFRLIPYKMMSPNFYRKFLIPPDWLSLSDGLIAFERRSNSILAAV